MAAANQASELVRSHYPPPNWPDHAEYLGSAGGFSGARFWRLRTAVGPLCLRRWPPEHPSHERLTFLHGAIAHVARAGFELLPQPIAAIHGETFITHAGHLWELTPWLPGRADYHQAPRPARLAAAMQALARFHLVAATHSAAPAGAQQSPGLAERYDQLRRLRTGGLEELIAAVQATSVVELDDIASRLVRGLPAAIDRAHAELAPVVETCVPLQPAIRDIWHDHVLFDGDRVSGIVDFGSLRVESVCGDVARLLGSLVGDDAQAWRAGLDAYEQMRPLGDAERRLLPVFDRTATALSAVNWLDWLYRDRRQFDDLRAIRARLLEIEQRIAAPGVQAEA